LAESPPDLKISGNASSRNQIEAAAPGSGACRSHVKQGILPIFPPIIGDENCGRFHTACPGEREEGRGNLTSEMQNERPLQAVDLNRTISEIEKVFRTVVEEKITVRTRFDLDLDQVNVDPRKLESILVTLFMRARDATPHGSEFTVTTSNSDPDRAAGLWVSLEILVIGEMDVPVTIRDLIRQVGGRITIKAVPGIEPSADGTVVTIALPAWRQAS
jgi:hypothetical protein